ncbi:MAG: T9SS type A sorting domain-containing protein, partial [Flavobacteriales bacterium]|nr:T9SS type A sorting domain-containing protein [Flavobacteriales bacterium]
NSFIYATPVEAASQYEFRIFNAGEGYDQTFVRNTYILQLKWNSNVAPPLMNGATYNVEVRAMVSGMWGDFCPSTCTITIDNGGGAGRPAGLLSLDEQAGFNIWPNPNNGDRLNVAMDGLDLSLTTVEARFVDLTGRTTLSTTLLVAEGRINTVMDLHDAANGTYLLQVVAGEHTFTQRVVVSK